MTTTAPAADTPKPRPGRRRFPMWRRILSAVLIVFSCALIPVSVLALWVRNEILNTDDYVRTVAPLAENQDIIDAVSVRITNTLFENVDVEELAKENLPPKISFLAGPLAGGLKIVHAGRDAAVLPVRSSSGSCGTSPIAGPTTQVEEGAHRWRHGDLDAQRSGHDRSLGDRGQACARTCRSAASASSTNSRSGRSRCATSSSTPASLGHAQSAVRLLNTLRWVLPVLVLGFGAGGIFARRQPPPRTAALGSRHRRGDARPRVRARARPRLLSRRVAGGRVPGRERGRVRHRRPPAPHVEPGAVRRSACSSRWAPTWPARPGSRSRCGAAPPAPSTASATGSRRAGSTSTASPSSSPGTRIRSGSRVSS